MRSLALTLTLSALAAAPALAQDRRRDRLVELVEEAVRADAERERGLDRTPAPQTRAEAEQQKEIRGALRARRLTVNFDKMPVLECLDFLRDVSGINLVLTKDAAEAIADKTVTLRLRNVTFRNILELLLPQVDPDLRYGVRNSVLMFGLKDEWKEDLVILELYDVADLVHQPPDFPAPRMGLGKDGATLESP